MKAQLSDFQFALKCSRLSSLPAQGLTGLAQSALRHLQNHGGQKTVTGEMKVLRLHDLEKLSFPKTQGSKTAVGNLIGSREMKCKHIST